MHTITLAQHAVKAAHPPPSRRPRSRKQPAARQHQGMSEYEAAEAAVRKTLIGAGYLEELTAGTAQAVDRPDEAPGDAETAYR